MCQQKHDDRNLKYSKEEIKKRHLQYTIIQVFEQKTKNEARWASGGKVMSRTVTSLLPRFISENVRHVRATISRVN